MLYDRDFLKKLDQQRNKTVYGRITALQFNGQPIQTIEGVITGGSISIDGSSAVRRTCSLTMVSETVDVGGYYWGLKTKFKLEIGVKNTVDTTKYPETIWFNQGVFIITSFSTSLSTTNYTINLQGKDKMCLLNGDIGGSLNASVQFDSWEQEMPDGTWELKKYPIKDIIRDAVHQYGGEPLSNIIINDLDDMGLELLEYRYDQPMFLLRQSGKVDYENATLHADHLFKGYHYWDSVKNEYATENENKETTIGAKDKQGNWIHSYDLLTESLVVDSHPTIFFDVDSKSGKTTQYCVAKIEYGETAGYRLTDMIYPDELIGNIGESVTSVLDKIRNLLGQFEYFYDLHGRFVFQKKQDYVNTLWSPQVDVEDGVDYVENMAYSTKYTYSFTGNELITSFNNTPNLNNLRNDYSVWGSKKDGTGKDLLIHMRYAIDEKPIYYKAYSGKQYSTNMSNSRSIYLPDSYEKWKGVSIWGPQDPLYQNNTLIFAVDKFSPEGTKWGWQAYYFDLAGMSNGTYHVNGFCNLLTNKAKQAELYISYCNKTGEQHNYPEESKLVTLNSNSAFTFSFTKNENDTQFLCFLLKGYANDTISEDSMCLAGITDLDIVFGDKPYINTDWREIIFQMQKDYRKHNHDDDFELQIIKNNPPNEEMKFAGYVTGQTGYEQYYIDLEGFWRQLYYPKYAYEEDLSKREYKITEKSNAQQSLIDKESGNVTDDVLYESLTKEIEQLKKDKKDFENNYKENYYAQNEERAFWHKNVFEAPHLLNYWLDFLDADGELNQFSCKAVGNRPKAVNDSNVKCIYFRETPAIIFASPSEKELYPEKTGYRYFQVGQWADMFSVSAQGKSAKEAIDELLYQHSYCSESASITALPVYYLEPNSRIYVHDETTHISGDYIVSKITIPLTYNGTMQLTTTKAAEQLI